MCIVGRSKLCLLCLLFYTLLPNITLGTSSGHRNKTNTYSQAKTTIDPGLTEDTELLQLKENMPELFDKDYYIHALMVEYGNGTGMTFEGFEHLLHKLGLGKIVIFDHSTDCHKYDSNSSFKSFHKSHNHSEGSDEPGSSNVHCKEEVDNKEHNHDNHEHSHDDHEHNHDDHEHNHVENEDSHDDHEHNNDGHEHNNDDHKHEKKNELPSKNTTETNSETAKVSAEGPPDMAYEDGEKEDHIHSIDHKHSKRSISKENTCLPAKTFLYISKSQELEYLSKDSFYDLCPSLIYQISKDSCHDYHDDNVHTHSSHQNDPHGDHDHVHDVDGLARSEGLRSVPSKVWGFSTIAVVIISLVGLLGVAVIPIMQKVFYNHMLQFLVALAVGALTGDALLHLLPHAMSSGHGGHDDHGDHGDHSDSVYKGLLGLMGIYFFFIIERVLTIFTDIKRRKKQKKNMKYRGSLEKIGEKLAAECDEMMMSVHPNKALQGYVDETHSEHCMISFENSSTISHQHDGKHKNQHHDHNNHSEAHNSDNEEHVDMLVSTSSSHGHGHSHCVDGAPNSIAAVAWMVILGDGIHNFSDGLAIGAAFANSITGGFSTSIAVFCHELPHEIGDFAMLLRAGMAPKQAIIYNCLSSILCFIGMLIGVAIGNIENASLWIFAVVGGMFLYIALVDMLPEMSSVDTKRGENPFCHLILQIVGMFVGASIMLIIALYEEQLKSILD